MLDIKDVYLIGHYEYGEAYYGSLSGMNFRINREPFVYAVKASDEEKAAARLSVTIWPGPKNFSTTPDEEKSTMDFDFSEEGKAEAVAYINKCYENDKERWDEIKNAGLLG